MKGEHPHPPLPLIASPCTDQQYKFALRLIDDENEMSLPVVEEQDGLMFLDGAMWTQRLLPIYDTSMSLLSAKHYSSLTDALVTMTVLVLYKADPCTKEEGFYLQVRRMDLITPGIKGRSESSTTI